VALARFGVAPDEHAPHERRLLVGLGAGRPRANGKRFHGAAGCIHAATALSRRYLLLFFFIIVGRQLPLFKELLIIIHFPDRKSFPSILTMWLVVCFIELLVPLINLNVSDVRQAFNHAITVRKEHNVINSLPLANSFLCRKSSDDPSRSAIAALRIL
jgi:hypothetical protein